jgi:hypothetical protein
MNYPLIPDSSILETPSLVPKLPLRLPNLRLMIRYHNTPTPTLSVYPSHH